MDHRKLAATEVLGLRPAGLALKQALRVFRGDPEVPPSRFDHTSLRIATPRLAVPTWLGRRVRSRTIPLLNLFNHTPTPVADGWSVRVTQVRDFRGRGLTYDSHNGTDFVVPPGTLTVAAAPGRVVAIRREFNRGGLKIYLHHGHGLITSHNHLGRALVRVGQSVARGEPVALTGYSGLDGLVGLPFIAPHVHYNVLHGGVLVDPFAPPGHTPLWRTGNLPTPSAGPAPDEAPPAPFDADRVAALLDDLIPGDRRRVLGAGDDLELRACGLLVEASVYPTRFRTLEAGRLLYGDPPARRPHLDLPFRAADFAGVAFADDLGYR